MASAGDPLLLVQLAAVFALAKGGSYLASLARIPPLIGEVIAGVVLANTLIGDRLRIDDATGLLSVLADLGVIFLIFVVGLEVSVRDLLRVGPTSLKAALLGIVLPFVGGAATLMAFGFDTTASVFVGVAFVATSVGITARVLADMGLLRTLPAQIILGAAVIDDVLGLLLLTVVSGIAASGAVSLAEVGIIVGSAAVFFVIASTLGRGMLRVTSPPVPEEGHRSLWSAFLHRQDFPVIIAITLCLGLAALASEFGLAAIIGAFLAGLLFEGTRHHHDLEHRMEALTLFFAPFFFIFIGLQVDISTLTSQWLLVLAVTGVALLTKIVGCAAGAWSTGRWNALAVGIGMAPRGEVGIIVALLGLNLGIVDRSVFGVVVAMSVLTTLIAPPLLGWALKRGGAQAEASAGA